MKQSKKLKPTYGELEAACKTLQEQVAQSVSLHQKLINAKNELDEELNRFRIIQNYGSNALQAGDLKSFLTLTIEHFAEAFEQPRVLFFEYDPAKKVLKKLEQLGYGEGEAPERLPMESDLLEGRACKLLHQAPALQRAFADLKLVEALICPFFDQNQAELGGVIVSGFTQRETSFMPSIRESDRASYAIMTQNAGLLLQNFRFLERLQEEIFERRQVEKALLLYQQKLEEHKRDLEKRVSQRTQDLADSNRQLQLEIEERRLIEQELRRSNAELEEFAYIASHDLKAPLRSIISFTQLLERRHGDQFDDEARSFMKFIKQGVKRFEQIINDLLHYARVFRSDAEPQAICLDHLLSVIIEGLHATIEKTEGRVEVAPLPALKVRKYAFEQLFQNLIDNALKFHRRGVAPLVQIAVEKQEEHFLFSVRDNGIGIEEGFQERIFGLFQRLHTETQYEGTGIGLSICKKVVSRHGGKIWFESDASGASFFFTIPRRLEAEPPED
jgi:signal transduction histidine kinase